MRRSSFLVTALLCACGSGKQSLILSSDPTTIAADGVSVVEVSADIIFRGDPIPDGKKVAYRASQPVLFSTREGATPEVVGGRRVGKTELSVTTKSGSARVYLLAPVAATSIEVSASFTTSNKDVLTDTLTFAVAAPPLVASGVGNGDPDTTENYFVFKCDRVNIGAFVVDRDEIQVPCEVTVKDVFGQTLPHVPVKFYTEAGEMRESPAASDSARRFIYAVPASPGVLPRDVLPWPAEADEGLTAYSDDPNINEYNPTDGLVTILAVVRGQEGFVDDNHNGVYDAGEPILDEGEPFLDVDDDGVFNDQFDPAPCCDSNGNNRVDGRNGKWDQDVWIGRMVHILWTGELENDLERTFILPSPCDITAEGQQNFTMRITDRNFNPLASNAQSDELTFTVSTAKVRFEPADWKTNGKALVGTTGMLLDDKFPRFYFGLGDAVTKPIFVGFEEENGVLRGREWQFTILDDRSTAAICTSAAWGVTTNARYTIAPAYSGASFGALSGSVSVFGNVLAKTPKPSHCP